MSVKLEEAIGHHQSGRLEEAERLYREIQAEEPGEADAHYLLGVLKLEQGEIAEALEEMRSAASLEPDRETYWFGLGNAQLARGDLDGAEASYRRAVGLKGDFVEAWGNLGAVLHRLGKHEESIGSYEKALSVSPGLVDIHCNLGNVFLSQERFPEALACYEQVLQDDPDNADAYCNIGVVRQRQGRLDEALRNFRKSILLGGEASSGTHSNLIFTLDMMFLSDISVLQAERREWGNLYANHLADAADFSNVADPGRRLRIGYVSADLGKHSAAVGFGAMLTQYDRACFEVFVYSNATGRDDNTRLFKNCASCWREISGLSDTVVAEMIRQDGIDILIDLSGHSAGHRLLVFARRSTPIQISAWGYAGGTGLREMDFLFSDPVVTPPDECESHMEGVRYLPCAIGGFFPEAFPEIKRAPAAATTVSARGNGNGIQSLFGRMGAGLIGGSLWKSGRTGRHSKNHGEIVFGSLNRLAKVSPEAISVWAQVLKALPSSRLLLKAVEFENASARDGIIEQFVSQGVDAQRICLLGRSSLNDHRSAFNRIDIALDTFPQSGGVTTLEGLMMGVPVVTLRGRSFVGRGSASILTTLGLEDWIAESEEEYVEIAVRKAGNLRELAELRRQLRYRLQESIIGDTEAYVKEVEKEYRTLWREWCARQVKES